MQYERSHRPSPRALLAESPYDASAWRRFVRLAAAYAAIGLRAGLRTIGAAALFFSISLVHATLRAFADDASPLTPYDTSRLQLGVFHVLPSAWMQDVLGTTGAPADAAFIIWRTLFFMPVLIAAAVAVAWGWRACIGLLSVFAALLLTADAFYFILPTRPPWMDIDVVRVISLQQGNGVRLDNNEFAALPSLHVGVVAAFGCWFCGGRGRGARWIAGAHALWAAAMAWAIVYSGEHYLVDALTGCGWAALAWLAMRRLGLAYGRVAVRDGETSAPDFIAADAAAGGGAERRAA